jgi:ABC-type transport system involved in multi-copper enzyme maturation permease subunit
MILLAVCFMAPILERTIQICSTNEFPTDVLSDTNPAVYMALIWCSGVIGNQVSDGTLPLLFSRPVSTVQYVTSKWFAVGSAAALTCLAQSLAELLIALCDYPFMIDPVSAATRVFVRTLISFGVAAFFTLLSSLVSGLKDLGVYFLLVILQTIMAGLAQIKADSVPYPFWKAVVQAVIPSSRAGSDILSGLLRPSIDIELMMSAATAVWSTIFFYIAAVTGCVALAVFVLNRKELPYSVD